MLTIKIGLSWLLLPLLLVLVIAPVNDRMRSPIIQRDLDTELIQGIVIPFVQVLGPQVKISVTLHVVLLRVHIVLHLAVLSVYQVEMILCDVQASDTIEDVYREHAIVVDAFAAEERHLQRAALLHTSFHITNAPHHHAVCGEVVFGSVRDLVFDDVVADVHAVGDGLQHVLDDAVVARVRRPSGSDRDQNYGREDTHHEGSHGLKNDGLAVTAPVP